MDLPTQEDIEKLSLEIQNKIENPLLYLNQHYKILLKKPNFSKSDTIILNHSKDHFMFCAPEIRNQYINRICFYLSLEQLQVPNNLW